MLAFFLIAGCAGELDDEVTASSEYAERKVTKGPIFLFYGAYCRSTKKKPKTYQPAGCKKQKRPACVFELNAMDKLTGNKGEVVVVTESVCNGGSYGPRHAFTVWRKRNSRRRLALKMPRWALNGSGGLREDSLAALLQGSGPEASNDGPIVAQVHRRIERLLDPNLFDYVALDEINYKYKKETEAEARAWRDGGYLARRLVLLLEKMSSAPQTSRRMIVYFNSYNLAVQKRLESYGEVVRAAGRHARIIASEVYNLNRSHLIDELAARFETLSPGSNKRMITVIGVSPKYKTFTRTHAESVAAAALQIRTGACPLTKKQPGIGGYSLTHMGKLPKSLRLGQAAALRKVMSIYGWPQAGPGQGKLADTSGCLNLQKSSNTGPEPGDEVTVAVDDEVINEDEEDLTAALADPSSLSAPLSRGLCHVFDSGGQLLGPAEAFQVRDSGGKPTFCIAGTQSCGSWFGQCNATTGGEVNFDIGRSFKIGAANPSHCPGDGTCHPSFTVHPGYKCAVFDYEAGVHKRTLWGTTFAFVRTSAGPTLACRAGTEPAAQRCRRHFGLCRGQAAPGPGDPCPCAPPLLCVRNTCRAPCAQQSCNGSGGCAAGETCWMTDSSVPVCMPGRTVGQGCDADNPCASDLICLASDEATSGLCYPTCSTSGASCSGGGTCTGGISGSSCLYCP